MKFKNEELVIPEDAPFKNDGLNREKIAEILFNIFEKIAEPFVFALDSSWGTGKTTFVKMFIRYLKNMDVECIYYNAWENDFVPDPLVSFIGELEGIIESNKGDDASKSLMKEAYKKVKDIGKTIVLNSIPAALKLATYGMLDMSKEVEDEAAKVIENIAKEKIESYKNQKKSLNDFKESLSEFAKKVNEKKEKQRPLFVFIDELDRCRPNFAIELLERIKHLFNVKGINFILSIDREQLCNSIKTIYGQEMNVEGYLRRFIDFSYSLPKPPYKGFIKILYERFCFEDFFDKRSKNREFAYDKKQFIDFLENIAKLLHLTLRDLEHCFMQSAITITSMPENNYFHPLIVVALITLKVSERNLYYGYMNNHYTEEDIIKYFKDKDKNNVVFKDNYGIALETYFMHDANKIDEMKKNYEKLSQSKIDKEKNMGINALDLISSILTDHEYKCDDKTVKNVLRMIEITSISN